MENFKIRTDKTKLDIGFIHNYLSEKSYWAKGRSLDVIKKSIQNSMCFGVYTNSGQQVGFARVVTDQAVFAWIMDLFVTDEYQGKGLGKMLMAEITTHPELQELKRWGLGTKDAHKLYEKFGFNPLSKPEIMMERIAGS